MFLHRINWPRTGCISFPKKCDANISLKDEIKITKRSFLDFFTLTNIANLGFQKMLRSYRGSLQTEIAFWLLFISCYEKLQPSWYHLQVSKCQHQKILNLPEMCHIESQNCQIFQVERVCKDSIFIVFVLIWMIITLMRKVELSNKPSVKSLQGNKKHNIILLPALFLFWTALNRAANSH